MKIYVADRQCGNFMDEVATVEEGRAIIKAYEEEDKKDGCYTPNFYSLAMKYEHPCERCTQKELAKWGSCNHGIGICNECIEYFEQESEKVRKELIKQIKNKK